MLPAAAVVLPLVSGWSVHSVWMRRRLDAARRDPLTGLHTRAGFERAAAGLLRRCPAAVVVVDLDGFKQINDSYGHAAGDEAIRMAGASLNEVVDGRGVVGRLGGDEFAAVVPLPDPVALPWLLGGLYGCLTAPFGYEGRTLAVGASVGGVYAPAGTPLPVALRRADEVMYGAKQSGGGPRVADGLTSACRTVLGRREGRAGTGLDGGVS